MTTYLENTNVAAARDCFECGAKSECDHHVVPRSRGGTQTVPLCGTCHARAHHSSHNMSHRTLTKAGLSAAKERGVLLGSSRTGHWDGREEKRLAGSQKGVRRASHLRTQAAKLHNNTAVTMARELRDRGVSWQQIVNVLNAQGLVTRRGNPWQKSSIFAAVKATT